MSAPQNELVEAGLRVIRNRVGAHGISVSMYAAKKEEREEIVMRKLFGSAVVALALAATANAQFCGSANVGIAIPDASAVGVTSIINVPTNFAITGIAVKRRDINCRRLSGGGWC